MTAFSGRSLRITAKAMLTTSICELELRAADGSPLPSSTAGAHVNVRTPNGEVRSYSLTGDSGDRGRYVIAVARQALGRGGSRSLVDDTMLGDALDVSTPANHFPLIDAPEYLFIAGGIGITPIRAMYRHIRRSSSAPVRLIYLTRTEAESAYLEDFRDDPAVRLHHSENGRLQLWPYVAAPQDGKRVYCCGPPSLMTDVRALTMHWRPSQLHFENFAGVSGLDGDARPFQVVWEPSGERIHVGADETLLDALNARGIDVPSSCASGTCGTCRLRLVAGNARHRDLVLNDRQRSELITPCVSRAADDLIMVAPADDT